MIPACVGLVLIVVVFALALLLRDRPPPPPPGVAAASAILNRWAERCPPAAVLRSSFASTNTPAFWQGQLARGR